MLSPSPPRPHGHAVAAHAASRRRALLAAFAAGALVAVLAMLVVGYRVSPETADAAAAWTTRTPSPRPPSNPLTRLALDGDGTVTEAPAPDAPQRPVGTAIIPLADAAAAPAAAASALAAAAAAPGAATAEVIVVAASPDAAGGLLGTAADSMPGLRLLVRDTGSIVNATAATLRNDGARAARAPLFTIVEPGVRLLPGYWDAVTAAATAHPQSAFFYVGGLPADTTLTPAPHEWKQGAPWTNPLPLATAVRASAWAAAGGYPETPLVARFADSLFAGVAAVRLPGGVSAVRADEGTLFDGAGAPPPSDLEATRTLIAAAMAIATAGAPLTPIHVLRAHEFILDGGATDGDLLAAIFDAASAAAAAPGLACPASSQTDLLAGLGREAAGRLDDAAAAYGRAARCATRVRVPALAWASALRADAVRVAALRKCAAKGAAAAEPGDAPRPVQEGAKADAGECVALMLGEVV